MAPLAAAARPGRLLVLAGPGGATAASGVHVTRHVMLVGELSAAARAGEARFDAALVLAVSAQVAPCAVEPAAALALRGRRAAAAGTAAASGTAAATGRAAALTGQKVPECRQELVCNTVTGERRVSGERRRPPMDTS